jgi:hypothetical protein
LRGSVPLAIRTLEQVAAGDIAEDQLAHWFREHLA